MVRQSTAVLTRLVGNTQPFIAPDSETAKKIRGFGHLPQGWHYGRGGPAEQKTIEVALAYLWYFSALGFFETNAFTGADGEIMVSAYRSSHCVEVTVDVDMFFTVSHDCDGKNMFYEPGLTGDVASLQLSRIASEIVKAECNLSAWFTPPITTTKQENLKTWLSLPLGTQHLFSTNNAGFVQAHQYAPTSVNSTQELAVSPQYFGDSTAADWMELAT
jgi:hypothetical protein